MDNPPQYPPEVIRQSKDLTDLDLWVDEIDRRFQAGFSAITTGNDDQPTEVFAHQLRGLLWRIAWELGFLEAQVVRSRKDGLVVFMLSVYEWSETRESGHWRSLYQVTLEDGKTCIRDGTQ